MAPEVKMRWLTVLNRRRDGSNPVPDIRMSGEWLARAGFAPGCLLAVTVELNRLVVTVEARPKPLPCHACGGEVVDG